MIDCYQIRVFGKVQGVWYRVSAKEKALELDIKGTVRNLPDGTVFIEAKCTGAQLISFIEWCKEGPPHAEVDSVEVKRMDGNKVLRDFHVIE